MDAGAVNDIDTDNTAGGGSGGSSFVLGDISNAVVANAAVLVPGSIRYTVSGPCRRQCTRTIVRHGCAVDTRNNCNALIAFRFSAFDAI